MNWVVVVEEKIKSRRKVWIIKVIEKNTVVYKCYGRWN